MATKLKKCKECQNLYGTSDGYLFGCAHHPVVTKYYKVNPDLFKKPVYDVKVDVNTNGN